MAVTGITVPSIPLDNMLASRSMGEPSRAEYGTSFVVEPRLSPIQFRGAHHV
jgi:hypothetical protein